MSNSRKWIAGSALVTILAVTGITIAQRPEHDINPRNHPILADAQRLCDQAFSRISDAQRANDWDMDGHAARAKQLLEQASHELKAAAESANRHRR